MSAIGREYIAYARQLSTNGCFSKAIDVYVSAFDKCPELKPIFELEFRDTVFKHNEVLAVSNKIEEIFANFGKAINVFPKSIYLLNEIGKYLFKYGYYEEAWTQFQKALSEDAGYVNAEKNLNSVKNLMVERWHFRMLNDKIRNDSYRAAIHEKVAPYETSVLDLGTGTGLLAMYATECCAKAVVACDSSEVMTNLSDCVLEENNLLLSVDIINKSSTTMDGEDIGGRRSLLVTELFDAGLFGEHILPSLSHAWAHLLSEPAHVIPQKADFFVMGAQSELLSAKYHLRPVVKSYLNISNLAVHAMSADDTYDCDDVYLYQDMKFVTEPKSIVKVDFTDCIDITNKISSVEPYVVELKASETGRVDGFVGWFNLYLTENITLTTDPRVKTRATAWQQAIFFDSIPRNIKENEILTHKFNMILGRLSLIPNDDTDILRITPEMLRFLNDTEFYQRIKSCIAMSCVYLGQMADICEINVIDLCPFPIFGLMMLKRGIKSLFCYAKTEYDKNFTETVLKANDIDMDRVTFLIAEDWTPECFKDDKIHAIFCNILDLGGDLDIRYKDIALFLKNNHLVQGGLFMPSSVTLVGQIVYSPWLEANNRVDDKNVGYQVAKHINKYQVSQNFGLDLTLVDYTPITDPVSLGDGFKLNADVINVPIKNDGDANAILCWYNIELMDNLEEVSTKRLYTYVDSLAFLANPSIPMVKGNTANILVCVDNDGSFKLMIDTETA
ncbi:protein arginine N-methyltransferase 9-like [Danaus plexippus]|uniref:protein arginine N-methyltransferase 9-like n=1 Tax=Danaus plexippus TaxID=13037 RepID=UPI002AAFEB90|nr:protein arginine N-methyltransferase 9-like [Danaus plexippus]